MKQFNAPLHHFCQCCDQTKRDGRRYWRLCTGQAFSAAWRQPEHTESSAARGFPHWNIAFARKFQWSVWWLPTELWSRWSHPRTGRRPGKGNVLMGELWLAGKEGKANTTVKYFKNPIVMVTPVKISKLLVWICRPVLNATAFNLHCVTYFYELTSQIVFFVS